KPDCASFAPISSPAAYSADSRGVRAEPNTVTARGTSASVPKPSMNSAWMRSTRHGSVCTQSVGPRLSRRRWSVVVAGTFLPRSVTGPCRCTRWLATATNLVPGPRSGQPRQQRVLGPDQLVHPAALVVPVGVLGLTGAEVHRGDPQRREPGDVGPPLLGPHRK